MFVKIKHPHFNNHKDYVDYFNHRIERERKVIVKQVEIIRLLEVERDFHLRAISQGGC